MVTISRNGVRAIVLGLLAVMIFGMDVEMAHAQSSQCSRLINALQQFDRNSDFRQFEGNSQAARQLQREVQNAESRYVRDGCNDDARAGRTLTRECQMVAREVLRLREQFANVSKSVETAGAIAQQREAILQEMARFGCAAQGSSANFSQERQGIFDRIFGSTTEGDFTNGDFVDGGDYWGYQGYNTIRTVCVRISDGYFWPISYSTISDFIGQDAQTCQAMCPNTAVDLYYYDNPGQEPEQMRNMSGSAYTSLPTAFAYRTNFDREASCQARPTSSGAITLASAPDGSNRSIIEVNGVSFPLPLRDPRGVVPVQAPVASAPVETVAMVEVPFPRRRPAGPGEVAALPASTQNAADQGLRIVHFGDKAVRVVGPDTPYAQAGRAGT